MTHPDQHVFASSHGDICYFEWGRAGSGPSVLLLHATGFHARCWDQVIAAFPDNIHVIAIDQLGHGRSAKPEITDWNMIADATAQLVTSLDIAFDIGVGHSMGGHCLVQVAAKLSGRIGRLILIDPVIMERETYLNPPDYSATNHMVAKRRNSWNGPDEMFERFCDRHPYRLWDPAVLGDYCQYGLLPADEGTFQLACPPKSEASVYATSTTIDPWPLMEKITQPVTVLRAPQIVQKGNFDFASSPTPPSLASKFLNGTDIYLENLTHFMPMQDPAGIAALILQNHS